VGALFDSKKVNHRSKKITGHKRVTEMILKIRYECSYIFFGLKVVNLTFFPFSEKYPWMMGIVKSKRGKWGTLSISFICYNVLREPLFQIALFLVQPVLISVNVGL
jgi:hypothetical protein